MGYWLSRIPFINYIFSEKFNDNARTSTAGTLATMAFFLPFSILFKVCKRLFNAFKKQKHPFYLQTFTQGVSVTPHLSFRNSTPTATHLQNYLATGCTAFLLKKTFRDINTRHFSLFHTCITTITVILMALAPYQL